MSIVYLTFYLIYRELHDIFYAVLFLFLTLNDGGAAMGRRIDWDELIRIAEITEQDEDLSKHCIRFVNSFDRESSEEQRAILWAMFLRSFGEYYIIRVLYLANPGSNLQTRALNVISAEYLSAEDALKLWVSMIGNIYDRRNELLSTVCFDKEIYEMIDIVVCFPTGSIIRLLYSLRIIEVFESDKKSESTLYYVDYIAQQKELIGSRLAAWCRKEYPDYFRK